MSQDKSSREASNAYDEVSREEALQLFGDTLQANIPLASIVKECQEQYDIFFVIPTNTNHGRDHALRVYWEKLLGADRVLLVRDTSVICDAIVSAVQGQPGNNLEDERNVRL